MFYSDNSNTLENNQTDEHTSDDAVVHTFHYFN